MSNNSVKNRLDDSIVKMGIISSKSQAKAFILEKRVKVNDVIVTKAGKLVKDTDKIEVAMPDKYVSRGGFKIESVFNKLNISVNGKSVLDIGASTGGFTDFLLQNGAEEVYAIDVGYGIIHEKLRQDKRVKLIERTNFRYFNPDTKIKWDFITADLSFISLTHILEKVFLYLNENGEALILIKPQFELTKEEVAKGGIVKDKEKQKKAVNKIKNFAVNIGFTVIDIIPSQLKGKKGNQEYFMYMKK